MPVKCVCSDRHIVTGFYLSEVLAFEWFGIDRLCLPFLTALHFAYTLCQSNQISTMPVYEKTLFWMTVKKQKLHNKAVMETQHVRYQINKHLSNLAAW